jgi:hypothetical protein
MALNVNTVLSQAGRLPVDVSRMAIELDAVKAKFTASIPVVSGSAKVKTKNSSPVSDCRHTE